jgi:hypothetical protein
MNSHCGICDRDSQCGYEYKPCDCCDYRKFKQKGTDMTHKLICVTCDSGVLLYPKVLRKPQERIRVGW